MNGLIMDLPLLIAPLIEHADRFHGDTEIVSRTVEGTLPAATAAPLHRYTYRDAHRRARQLANALHRLGVAQGERVATLAWNGYRHVELYYAISGSAAVTHTINPRLFPEQIAWIINDAEDRVLFFDLTFAPLVEKLAPLCPSVRQWVAMTDRAHMPKLKLAPLLCFEELVAAESADYVWPTFDEKTASSLCYTSGTTGNPKGVLYSHRSTLLHAYASAQPDVMGLSARDVVLPVVPMFHVNAWGIPYSAAMVGFKLVLPGPALDGPSLCELFEQEGVTYSAGVPTVWQGFLQYTREQKLRPKTLRRCLVGGSACPPALMRAMQDELGIEMRVGWGMTEMSPLGSVGMLKNKHLDQSPEQQLAIMLKAGRPVFGVEIKITDTEGASLPHDGKAFGDLLVRGPWVVERYFNAEKSALKADGWFATGDVATIDPDGFIQITDRSKDVIKSGGEWISSIELENIAMSHPAIAEAAVIGVQHPKWDERPLLIVVRKPGEEIAKDELLRFYDGKIAKWWTPDDVAFVEQIPHTATGKISKLQLREQFRNHALAA